MDPKVQKYLKPKYKQIAKEVARILDDGVVARINSVSFDLPEEQFQQRANETFRLILTDTHYDNDSRFFINRLNVLINTIVSEASIELYKGGNADMIYALASGNVVKEMKAYSGKQKFTVDAVNDARKAKGQAVDLISNFVYAFEKPLKRSLKELALPENIRRRAVERGHLCLQLLGLDGETFRRRHSGDFFSDDSDNFYDSVVVPLCEGATIPSVLGTPEAPTVSRATWNLPVEARICGHQNWRRKLLIFEKGI